MKSIPLFAHSLIVLGLILCVPSRSVYCGDRQALDPTGQVPIWRVDLHPLGFGSDQAQRGEYWLTRFMRAVAITRSGDVGVIFHTFKMTSRGFVPGTWSTHFVIVDRDSGKVRTSKEWPMADRPDVPSIITTPDAHLLVYSDFSSALALYSSNLELISSVNFERHADSNWVSTDGRYFFYEVRDGSRYGLTMIETSMLKTVQSWTSDFPIAAASNRYLARWEQAKDQDRRSLFVRSRDSEWKEIYRDTGCAFAQFLTDDFLLVRSCDKATTLNTHGDIACAVTIPPKHDMRLFFGTSRVGTSSDGKRFAISTAQLKKQPWWTGDPGFDKVHPTLIVYDAASCVPISSFSLNKNEERPFAFALSADGSMLALLRSGFLELYRLPDKP